MKSLLGIMATMAAGIFFLEGSAIATPIVYDFTGNLTGSIGSKALNGAAFNFSFSGDTSNIYTVNYFIIGLTPVNPALSSSVSIAGVGSGSFLDSIVVQNFLTNGVPNFQDNSTFSGYLTGANPAAIGWNLATPIGPLALSGGGAGGSFITSLGTLSLTSVTNVTFSASVTTPEPSTAIFLILGLVGAGLCRARQVMRR